MIELFYMKKKHVEVDMSNCANYKKIIKASSILSMSNIMLCTKS